MAATTGKKRVTFKLEAPQAQEVYLCGSFNGWDEKKTMMKRTGDGRWQAQVLLTPGTYEYRYRIDGTWVNDPQAEASVPNGFGTANCLRTV